MSKLIRIATAKTGLAIRFVVVALTAALTLTTTATAAPVPIVSYDIAQTARSGFGCWFHDYNGTIANSGRTVSYVVICSAEGTQIADYSGGSGTLNDGIVSTSINSTHLFTTINAEDGQPISPVITLHLGGTYVVKTIRFFGGDFLDNTIPGALNGVTVEIGGTAVAVETVPFGTTNLVGVRVNDMVDLTTTALSGVATNQIVLRNFTSSIDGFFSIAEITLDDAPPAMVVAIDIKPGIFPNSINTRNQGTIAVAILSTATFDAVSAVDKTSLTFGRVGDEDSLAFCDTPKDVNKDKRDDLVCYFHTQSTGFVLGDTVGILYGETVDGTPIQGADSVRIVH
jgi:hypothetical protein